MTLAEEKALLARFAKMAGAGEMLNIHDLKAAYEKAIGHVTSDSTVYNLLHRHGWRKLMPRPFHPKRDLAAQNAFKKNRFPDAVRKARRAAARRERRLRIMFADEARFGRMNRIRPCWAPIATRPEVAAQLIREYIYLYGAGSRDGDGRDSNQESRSDGPNDGVHLRGPLRLLDHADLEYNVLPALPQVLARRFARQDILLVLDGAPNHRAVILPFPTTSRSCIFRPIHRNSIQRKTSGMKSAKKSSRTMRLNPWTPCAPNSGRLSSTSSAIASSSAPSPPSPVSSTHSDVELV
jgi:hypothetical protein